MSAASADTDHLFSVIAEVAEACRFTIIGRSAVAGLLLTLAATAATAQSSQEASSQPAAATPGADAPPLGAEPESPMRWSTSTDFSGGNYRWSLSRGAVAFRLGFEAPSRPVSIASTPLDNSGPLVQTLPSVSLDLRSVDSPRGGWLKQLSGSESPVTSFTHRLGIEWKPAESQLMFVREGLGVRLNGDDRLTMRLRKGTLGIYMQRKF
jgi:hypothetical protein